MACANEKCTSSVRFAPLGEGVEVAMVSVLFFAGGHCNHGCSVGLDLSRISHPSANDIGVHV